MHRSEAVSLIEALKGKGATVSFAESCTGGMISSWITDVPGSSEVFLGGAVTYSNSSKENIIGVSNDTLMEHGAVSEKTAREMASGVMNAFGSDYSLAVTGIAGPGGATETKPVGLVYIAVADGPRIIVTRNEFKGDRSSVREQTAKEALSLLTDMVKGLL